MFAGGWCVCLALHYSWALGKRRQQSRQAAPSTRQMALKLGERGEGGRWRECRKEREGEVMGQTGKFGLSLNENHIKIQPKANLRGVTITQDH